MQQDQKKTQYELVRADGVVSPMKFDTAMQAAGALVQFRAGLIGKRQ